VRYGALIEAARPWIEARQQRPLAVRVRRRLALALLPHRARLRLALAPLRLAERLGLLGLARRLAGVLPAGVSYLVQLLPVPLRASARLAADTAAEGNERAAVALLAGCVVPELCAATCEATVAVLTANGCRVRVPPAQGCCGALALHAGHRAEAEALARRNVEAFADAPVIVANAAGCGAMMKEYGALLADDPRYAARAAALAARVRDVSELLAALPLRAPRSHGRRLRVAYHDPCHLAHAQGIRAAPRTLLRAIPGIELVPMDDEDLCCGSAGDYNLMQPELARRLLARKVAAIRASGAELVATANSGCALQLEAGLRLAGVTVPVRHVVDLLAAAYAAEPSR
jgi:glycolate oxidase iron-sulfur subunit